MILSPPLGSPSFPAPSPSPLPQPVTSDVFEIEDFSMATGWERLIRQVEERMVEWRIDHGKMGRKRTVAGRDEKEINDEAAVDGERRCELHYNSKTYLLTCRLPTTAASSASSSATDASLYLPTRPATPFVPATLPPFSLCLGLPSYLLLTPCPPRRVSRNESALLLSTLTLAASAVACPLPLLAPFGLPHQHQYQGRTAVGEGWQFHVRSSEAVVERVRWLSGLEEWWEVQRRRQRDRVSECGLIAAPTADDTSSAAEQLSVTVLHTFHLNSTYSSISSSYPSSMESCTWRDTSLDAHTSYGVPWGPVTDPLGSLALTAVWQATDSSFSETASYSELDAISAPEWRLGVTWRDEGRDRDSAAFVEALKALVELGQRARQTKSLADVMGTGETAAVAGGGAGGTALSTPQKQRGITKSSSFSTPSPSQTAASSSSSSPSSASRASPSAFTAIKAVQSSLQAHIESAHLNAMYGEPLSHDYVDGVMKQLMDIQPDEAHRKQLPYSPTQSTTSVSPTYCDPVRSACPYGSLLSLLVCQLLLLHGKGLFSVRAVAHFWVEFVQELRYHFEAGLVLPHMAAGDADGDGESGDGAVGGGGSAGMDYNGCVVWQKMQVLQQCIVVSRQRQQWMTDNNGRIAATAAAGEEATAATTEAKRAHDEELADGWQEFDLPPVTPKAGKRQKHEDDAMDTEEEQKKHDGPAREEEAELQEPAPTITLQQASQQSCGASHPLKSHTLLCIDRPLLVPYTQPSPLLTTDQLDQQADLFSRLPEDETVEAMRREAQEAGLRSDMSAFKAANPGCIMEDFVRWHSPRDWTANGSVRGQLSERMRYKGNRWRNLWLESTSVPAWEQVPLFDPLVTGERVLSELEHVDPTSLFAQLTAVAACNWMSAMARTPPVMSSIGDVRQRLSDTHGWLRALPSPYQPAAPEMWDELTSVELQCARITSLLYCFPTCLSLIDRLLTSPHHAAVSTSDERDAVLSIFAVPERNIHATKPGQAATTQRMPKADVRQYVLHASSGDRQGGVGEWLYARVEEREEDRTVAVQSSYSMKEVKEGRVGAVAAVGSRRLRRGRGGARRVVVRSNDDGESGEEAEDEPVFVLATSLLTHWPLT